MSALQGLVVFCPTICSKRGSMRTFAVDGGLFPGGMTFRSGFWGSQVGCGGEVKVLSPQRKPRMQFVCSSSLFSTGNSSMSEDFLENDEDYVNCSVSEAVEVKRGVDGLLIQMQDGRYLRCAHNNPRAGHMPDYAPHPAFVLKMEDGSDLLLPIIALPSKVLVHIEGVETPFDRSTLIELMKESIEKEGGHSIVKHVRVTKRHEAYCAKLYFTKVGDETNSIYFQRRPSLAIGIALSCKAPIQVNKHLAFSDGVRVVESSKLEIHTTGVDKEREQPLILLEDFWEDEEQLNVMKDMHQEIITKRWMDILINPLMWLQLFISSSVEANKLRSKLRRRKSTS